MRKDDADGAAARAPLGLLTRETPRPRRTELTADLFAQLGHTSDREARAVLQHEIVLANASVARGIARRYRNRGIDTDDLEQTAYLTLVVAVLRFDPSRGHDFLSFAVPCVLGELRRHFRDDGWTIRVPRRVQEVQRLIDRADVVARDEPRYGTATVTALAERLALPAHEVEAALCARGCFTPASLDARTERHAAAGLGDPLERDRAAHEAVEARAVFSPVWRHFDPREQQVLRMRYAEDRTQSDIASQLGLSQAQVSRILARLLEQLRATLTDGVDSSELTG